MGWLPREHRCELPTHDLVAAAVGDGWQCDECGAVYHVAYVDRGRKGFIL